MSRFCSGVLVWYCRCRDDHAYVLGMVAVEAPARTAKCDTIFGRLYITPVIPKVG